ncbi:MAG: STAS domain-containing protein [Bacillota bacterium]
MQQVIDMMNQNERLLYEKWENSVKSLQSIDSDEKQKLFDMIFSIISGSDEKSADYLRDWYERYFKQDDSLTYLVKSIQEFRRSLIELALSDENSAILVNELYESVDKWFDPIIADLVSDCSNSWNTEFRKQQHIVKELTAPMIPISTSICILPLIGNINDDRAEVIKENLLIGVEHYKCNHIFIDITGVPVVDTFVANHLMQAAEAVQLLGASCIIVGIRPEIAQTLINLGISIDNIQTFSNLHTGIQYVTKKGQKEQRS